MPLLRILVDGYSLLHAWPELAEGQPRHSAGAREALVQELTHYHDVTGTPITIFFDGAGAPKGTPQPVVARLNELLVKAARSQTASNFYRSTGTEVFTSTPAELSTFLRAEITRWAQVVREANIKAE